MGNVDSSLNRWVSDTESTSAVCLLSFEDDLLDLNDCIEVEERNIVLHVETMPESREHKGHY